MVSAVSFRDAKEKRVKTPSNVAHTSVDLLLRVLRHYLLHWLQKLSANLPKPSKSTKNLLSRLHWRLPLTPPAPGRPRLFRHMTVTATAVLSTVAAARPDPPRRGATAVARHRHAPMKPDALSLPSPVLFARPAGGRGSRRRQFASAPAAAADDGGGSTPGFGPAPIVP